MSSKKSAAAKSAPRSSTKADTPDRHPTGPNVETFEPSHGPNLSDRSDTDTGDEGQEVEKAGRSGGRE